jgi:hypothetical protein
LVDPHPLCYKWPEWLGEAVGELEGMVLILEWREMLVAWLELEEKLGWEPSM